MMQVRVAQINLRIIGMSLPNFLTLPRPNQAKAELFPTATSRYCRACANHFRNFSAQKPEIYMQRNVLPSPFHVHSECSCIHETNNMQEQGNLYYDISCCGIGFHGDSERRKVVAVRLGAAFPLQFQWFVRSSPVGKRVNVDLHHGDM
jgi:hypothetical protein